MACQHDAENRLEGGYQPAKVGEIAYLLERIRAGDREAAARFVLRNEHKIRRRIRWKLGPRARRLMDSNDIVSSLARRLDSYVRDQKLHAPTEAALWRYIMDIALSTTVNKDKSVARSLRLERRDSPWGRATLERSRSEQNESEVRSQENVASALSELIDPTDKQILTLWLMDADYAAISQDVGLSLPAVRKRWQRIRERLRTAYEEDRIW